MSTPVSPLQIGPHTVRPPVVLAPMAGITNAPFRTLSREFSGGKGLFVKEIEEALLEGRAQLAVHSIKDVPGVLPPGLFIACVPKREDPRDVLVAPKYGTLAQLPEGAKVGTSSLRRAVSLKASRPDLHIVPMRGNVDTRLRKVDAGECDAIVLAQRVGQQPGRSRVGVGAMACATGVDGVQVARDRRIGRRVRQQRRDAGVGLARPACRFGAGRRRSFASSRSQYSIRNFSLSGIGA